MNAVPNTYTIAVNVQLQETSRRSANFGLESATMAFSTNRFFSGWAIRDLLTMASVGLLLECSWILHSRSTCVHGFHPVAIGFGKFIFIPSLFILYSSLFISGLFVRKQSAHGVLMSFSQISDLADEVSMAEIAKLCFTYFFDFFLIGQGVVSALSRRAQIPGKCK